MIDEPTREKIREILARNDSLASNRAPDFGARERWLNVSRPLGLHRDLRGKLVLVDFWTYCCINCMHVLPDLEHLEEKYRDQPLAVVGCHSAKFENEADVEHVREAVLRYRIQHPVVVDEDFRIWRSYGIQGWPGMALIGPASNVLAILGGEGNRELLDVMIEEALGLYWKKGVAWNREPLPILLESERVAEADLAFPGKLVASPDGRSLFVSDSNHDRIVEIGLDGTFRRALGSGESGARDGSIAEATFDQPQGLAFWRGQLLVADTENHLVRSVDLDRGVVETIAGAGGQGHERRGTWPAREVQLNSPWDLLVRGDDVFIAMAGPHQIWKLHVDSGLVEAWAGDGSERILDGALGTSAFAQPSGLASDGERLFVADSESSAIRAIDLRDGIVTTVAGASDEPRDLFHFGDEDGVGPGRRFQHPLGVHFSGGSLWVADTYNHKVKRVDVASRRVTTFAGDGSAGKADGVPGRFFEPSGLVAIGERLFVADTNNHAIRVVDLGSREVRTLPLRGVPIPRRRTARPAGRMDSIPQLPGEKVHAPAEVVVRPGRGVLEVGIVPPRGRKLAEEAPHLASVESSDPAIAFESVHERLNGGSASLPFEAREGSGEVRVRAIYYHCGDDGACQVQTLAWPVRVTVAAGGTDRIAVAETPSSE